MHMEQPLGAGPSLEFRLGQIEKTAEDLSLFPSDYYVPMGAALTDIEWYSLAAIKKTASQSHAFCTLVRAKNTLSATATIRLQIDTAMRIFGLSLIRDIETAGTRLMNGESYRRLKSRDNEKLTDAYLHQELNKMYPGVSQAYEDTSAYVHLSGEHIKNGLVLGPGQLGMFLHLNGTDAARPDDYFFSIVDSFDQASRLTASLIMDFIRTRPGPEVRAQELLARRRAAGQL